MKKTKSPFTDWYYRSKKCIAQGALTNSKRPECFVLGKYPTHIKSGQGAIITDVRDYKYTDYICSLGANLFGHANQRISNRVSSQLMKGSVFSLGSNVEVLAAERLKGLFPFIDRVKFLKTGTEACMAAIKIARAYTGKERILVENYHGWADAFVDSPPAHGVNSGTLKNTFRGIEEHRIGLESGCFAAVIIEPVELDMSKERIEWLNALRETCTKHKTLLIFDEIITGFRVPKLSISKHLGITPDIICLGKAMGGGLPLAAVGASEEIMESVEYFVSSTFGGDTLALSAFMEVLDMFLESKWSIDKLWFKGAQFIKNFNELWPEKLQIKGYNTRGVFVGDEMVKWLFWQECAKSGILFGSSWFYNFPLMEHNDETLDICKDVLNNIKAGRVELEGSSPQTPFAAKQRE